MQEKSLIKKNILKFLDSQGISKYEFYKRTGITRGILDQNNGMSEENTARFLAVFGNEVSTDWLIRGIGEIYSPKQNTLHPVSYKEAVSSIDLLNETDIRILAKNETIKILKEQIVKQDLQIVKQDLQITELRDTINYYKKWLDRLEGDMKKPSSG